MHLVELLSSSANVIAALSLILNVVLIHCIIMLSLQSSQNDNSTFLEGNVQASQDHSFLDLRRKELEHAEEIYQRNMMRRSETFRRGPPYAEKKDNIVTYWMSPLYPCFGERLGQWGDGGKWLCRTKALDQQPHVVYSIGCRGDISFENDIWKVFGIKPFTFDPTLNSTEEARMRDADFMHFYPIGITHEDDGAAALSRFRFKTSRDAKMMRLEQVMMMLNHSFVDVLKIDCEGCELDVMQRIGKDHARHKPLFGQILMELHTDHNFFERFQLLEVMESMGYRLFHVETNYLWPTAHELAYIHETLLHR